MVTLLSLLRPGFESYQLQHGFNAGMSFTIYSQCLVVFPQGFSSTVRRTRNHSDYDWDCLIRLRLALTNVTLGEIKHGIVVLFVLVILITVPCRNGYEENHLIWQIFPIRETILQNPFHKDTYVLLCLRVQNRRKKWHFPPNFWNGIIWSAPFPLNIRNVIIWGMAFPKHLGLQKHVFR